MLSEVTLGAPVINGSQMRDQYRKIQLRSAEQVGILQQLIE